MLVLVATKGDQYLHAGLEAFPHANVASGSIMIKEVNASPVSGSPESSAGEHNTAGHSSAAQQERACPPRRACTCG